MTNEQLVIRIQAGENVAENMAQLYDQVRRFIHSLAWRYRDSGEMEDLEQEGYLALYPAIDGYDPGQGVKFLTYASHWIEQQMRRYIQNNSSSLRLPVHRLESVKQLRRFRADFERENGRKPTEWESCCLMGLTLEEYQERDKLARIGRCASLDTPVEGLEDESITLADAIADPGSLEEDTVDRLQAEQLKAVLWGCVEARDGEQPEVLRMRYREGLALREIGEMRGVTPEAVRQTERKALRELRKPRYANKLRPFVPEDERIYSMGLMGNGVDHFNHTWTSSTERAALWLMEG